jgi:hypothetical protein
MQSETFSVFNDVNFKDLNSVPLWDPSQKGCLADLPQGQNA